GGGVCPTTPPPPSPMPKAILGVSFPSFGGAGTWAAARGIAAKGASELAPRTSIAVLRENFMVGTPLTKVNSKHVGQDRILQADSQSAFFVPSATGCRPAPHSGKPQLAVFHDRQIAP